MSAGVLIYCFDTPRVLYHPMVNLCIDLVRLNLKLPVTVVTNKETMPFIQHADGCVLVDNQKKNYRHHKHMLVPWYNQERSSAYEHSPYGTTILLDADYLVYTDNLLQVIKGASDFMLHDRVHDLTNRNIFDYPTKSMIPMVWATVVIFRKTAFAQNIFSMVKHVQQHYDYYCNLYRIDFANFRNDYAFAMALNQLSPDKNLYSLPTAMNMLPMDAKVLKADHDGIVFSYEKFINFVTAQDTHVLDKEAIINV